MFFSRKLTGSRILTRLPPFLFQHSGSDVLPDARCLRVLLVEDNNADVRLFQLAAQSAGCAVELAVRLDGEAAISFLQEQGQGAAPLDLVVTDLNLPGCSGFVVLEFVKSSPVWRDVPVMVFSGSDNDADIGRSSGLGAATYLIKPAGLEQYVEVVHRLLERWSRVVHPPNASEAAHISQSDTPKTRSSARS